MTRAGTKRRWTAAVFASASIMSGVAGAQLLDLRTIPAPPAGSGASTLALAERLRREADEMDAGSGIAGGAARAALRRAACELAERGEAEGSAGSTLVLLARTIASRAAELDAALAAAPPPDAAMIARDLDAARASGALIRAPEHTLRDALASVSGRADPAGATPGWFSLEPAPPGAAGALTAAVDRWAGAGAISADTALALRGLDATLRAADAWASYAPSAARVRGLLLSASGVLEDREWIDPPARRALADRFDRAARALAESGDAAGLERLASVAALLDGFARLDASRHAGGVRAARAALVQWAAGPSGQPDDAERTAVVARALALAAPRDDQPADASLPRPVRPAWRALVALARQDEPGVLTALGELVRRPDAGTEPGIVAVLGRAGRTRDDLRLLAAAARLIGEPPRREGGEPAIRPEFDRVASRLLELGQRVGRPDTRDAARDELRGFVDRFVRVHALPGADALASAIAAGGTERGVWSQVTGVQELTLQAELADRRRFWREAWEKGDTEAAAEQGARCDTLARLLGVQLDAARALACLRDARAGGGEPAPRDRALRDWPGWEMSPEALAAITEGLADRLGRATTLALGPDPASAAREIDGVSTDFAAALLCGRLLAQFESRSPAPGAGAGAALRELATGGPVDSGPGASWLAPIRLELADVCRYAEELAAPGVAPDRARVLRAYVNARASAALDWLARAP